MKSIDLIIVISDLGGGGAQRVLVNMMHEWGKLNYKLTLITINSKQEDFFKMPGEVKRVRLFLGYPSKNIVSAVVNNLRRVFVLRKEFKKTHADIILSFIGTTNILTLISSVGLDSKVIISERNDPAKQSLGRLWDTLRKYIYPWAAYVTANSKAAINTLSSYVAGEKLKYTPNPIVVPDNINAVHYKKPSFLAVGRLHEQKAYDVILQAFAKSNAISEGWGLTILGDGQLKGKLVDLAIRLGVNELVDWKGKVDEPFSYYASARAFLLPSRYEGMPNSLLEAMSMGLPCVISDALHGPMEFVEDGKTGWIVPVGDVQALADWMSMIIEQSDEISQIAQHGKEVVLSHMSMQKSVSIWHTIFESVKCNSKVQKST